MLTKHHEITPELFFLEKWKIRFSIMSYKMDKNGKKIKQNEGWS